MTDHADIFGYFDTPEQTMPAYDPGLNVPCPLCLGFLKGKPMKTISLLAVGDTRSFFFRAHKQCWEKASEEEQSQIESSLVDARRGERRDKQP